jgi:CheY-like chemotaxis protein
VPQGRPTTLVIHDEGDALDLLTRMFEAGGFEVVTAVTGFRAQAVLESDRPIDVVVAPWSEAHPVGGDVYRWAIQRRYDLRDQFVFIASEVPPDFDPLVAGRCLAVSMVRPAEIVRVARAAVKRRLEVEAARERITDELDSAKPTLLLVDDEPVLLMAMADLLGARGYLVTRVEHGRGAITQLELEDFDAIVCDWHMDDGTGADVYRWLREFKPWLAERIVFLSDDDGAHPPGFARPILRKGQDSDELTALLRDLRRRGSRA